jgi:hypothetical protein
MVEMLDVKSEGMQPLTQNGSLGNTETVHLLPAPHLHLGTCPNANM